MGQERGLKFLRRIALPLAMLATIACLTSCGKPNEKLKIYGKKYTISLGRVDYDADAGLITIQVLADGEPLQNNITYTNSSITIGGEVVSSNVSASQPVKVGRLIGNRRVFADQAMNTGEDGVFVFPVDEMPYKIDVYTGNATGSETVYFDAATKQVISSGEYFPSIKREQEE